MNSGRDDIRSFPFFAAWQCQQAPYDMCLDQEVLNELPCDANPT